MANLGGEALRFRRIGKTYQLRIETGDDLREVPALDDSLWVATSAPIADFNIDPVFIKLVDTDNNGRIYTREMREAIEWLFARLADTSRLAEGASSIALDAIRDDTPETGELLRSARFILQSAGAADEDSISVQQVREFQAGVRSRILNGDGIVGPKAANDPETASFIEDAMATTGKEEDVSGRQGISEALLDRFVAAVNDYLDWKDASALPEGRASSELMPLGEDTPAAAAVYLKHRDKIDLFYALCRVLRYEPRAEARLKWPGAALDRLDSGDYGDLEEFLRDAPIAEARPDGVLPLDADRVNPYYCDWIESLKRRVLRPIIGSVPDDLREEDWTRIGTVLAPYEQYLSARKGAEVEGLPDEKLRRYREGAYAAKARELIAADRQVADMLAGVKELERLLLYHQHLLALANNFVSFPQLYDPDQTALFEQGSAVIDGRWFCFAVRVNDLAAHERTVRSSNIFVMYLEISGKNDGEKFIVAIPATSGTRGNLTVGKRGVFFDRDGNEYDAAVVKVVESPISMGEALVVPFRRIGQFFAGKIQSLASSAEKGFDKKLDKALVASRQGGPQLQPAQPAGSPAGMFIGVGVAVAALGSAFAYIMKILSGLEAFQILIGIAGAVLVVMLPVAIIAWLRLRKQDLSAILEGCGWAVNAHMRLTRAQRRQFSAERPYPKGAQGTPWPRWARLLARIVMIGVLAGGAGYGLRAGAAYLEKRRPPKAEEAGKAEQGDASPAADATPEATK